ncbi:sigma-54-dependent transcriptional regulator [Engelhardtia mirabilis]|uniref:Transcriptional regulatory protein ZraR n=1 Tax=Engelhardtia mirabilis TaxID=2528011 RepID=A0A518BQW6_9BACT|nr:Transcriptional regulatory protein ZraR [Planctomycetes bacterium Pla133]QDV03703.1 Transcriptional regulatory protein ZraR [Planctomycetes bacterium Pla86]
MYDCLLLDDDRRTREVLARLVDGDDFKARLAPDIATARRLAGERFPDCAILDLDLPDGNGLDFFKELREQGEVEVLILTGQGTIDTAVTALKSGAIDFLTKPVEPIRLESAMLAIRRTLSLKAEVNNLRAVLRQEGRFAGMVGTSSSMQGVFSMIEKAAPSESSVLILGETGTGKELVARALHRFSRRADKPFVAFNCGAIQSSLLESELFGHEAGSFTGAGKRRLGYFEQAKGGTVFLDEIFEMPLEQQVNLLRVLENRQITRVGGESPIDVDVRVVAASNKSATAALEDRSVREDLLYRLMVFPIHVPPLRERREDVRCLAQFFLDSLVRLAGIPKRFSADALAKLEGHDWPGNVRELRNIVERACILSDDVIDAGCIVFDDHALFRSRGVSQASIRPSIGGAVTVEPGMSIAEAERLLILTTLDCLSGNKPKAAELLGISLKTLYNRLNVYSASAGA